MRCVRLTHALKGLPILLTCMLTYLLKIILNDTYEKGVVHKNSFSLGLHVIPHETSALCVQVEKLIIVCQYGTHKT